MSKRSPGFSLSGSRWQCCWMLALAVASFAGGGGSSELVEAVKTRDAEGVRELLARDSGVDVNAREGDGATALHWAAHLDALPSATLLIDGGADVNAGNDYGVTPLSLACTNGNAAMVETLLGAGADPNLALTTGETPLMTASRTGRLDAVQALLAAGAEVNAAEPSQGQTALMWAISEQHSDVAQALIASGADVTARSEGGFSPLLFAAREGDLASARAVLEAGASVEETAPSGTSALLVAAVRGHTALVIWLLEQGADPNAAEAGYTALHWAAGSWETELTGQRGIVTDRDDEWRALRGVPTEKLEMVKALLAHGADPNARLVKSPPRVGFSVFNSKSLEGATPFWLAAMAADVDMLRVLSASGADLRIATTNDPPSPAFIGLPTVHRDTTPLMVAAGVGRNLAESGVTNSRALGAVAFIWELGGDVNAVNQAGNTALHGAARVRSEALVQFLVDKGATVTVTNESGETPLFVAERYLHPGTAPVIARTSTGDLLRELGAQ